MNKKYRIFESASEINYDAKNNIGRYNVFERIRNTECLTN